MTHKTLQPEGWLAPKGYANGIEARGRQVFVGGQIGWNAYAFQLDQQRHKLIRCVWQVLEYGFGMRALVRGVSVLNKPMRIF